MPYFDPPHILCIFKIDPQNQASKKIVPARPLAWDVINDRSTNPGGGLPYETDGDAQRPKGDHLGVAQAFCDPKGDQSGRGLSKF